MEYIIAIYFLLNAHLGQTTGEREFQCEGRKNSQLHRAENLAAATRSE
jgi:hypothetical protein